MSAASIDLTGLAEDAKQLITTRRAGARPTRCSQCLGGSTRPMFVTQKDEPEVYLCNLRCMALWALQHGWSKSE